MRKKFAIIVLALVLLGTGLFIYSCRNRSLRGWWEKSSDGRTYLIVADSDGGKCPPIYIDGLEVSLVIGDRIQIGPGEHKINCGDDPDKQKGILFTVETGTVFYFDYWGP